MSSFRTLCPEILQHKIGVFRAARPSLLRNPEQYAKRPCSIFDLETLLSYLCTMIHLSPEKNGAKRDTIIEEETLTKVLTSNGLEKEEIVGAVDVIIKSNGKKEIRKFKQNKITIGSSPSNDISIADDYVSKNHCKLIFENNCLFLTDIGSTNGTFFEGEQIKKVTIAKSAEFSIGKSSIYIRRTPEKKSGEAIREFRLGQMIGTSTSMLEVFALVKKTAHSDVTVCIVGESGTGKELVAHSIHEEGQRGKYPFVAINCGAIPPNIIESELFGHEKGSFTGATQMHNGVFEQANMGTILLDEIGEMPLDMQTRLLRVIETKTVRRIGGHRDIPVNVRIIAATNRDIKELVRTGKFREDLFFRLYVFPIHIPPLRERKEDIVILARHFTKLFSPGESEKEFTPKAIDKLNQHHWAGNVRELKNTIQRAIIMSHSDSISFLDIDFTGIANPGDEHSMPLDCQEKESIVEALRRCKCNQIKAAALLGIARTTISAKITKYGINLKVLKLTC